jgi:hypothetical protein
MREGYRYRPQKTPEPGKMVDMCGNVELGSIPKTVYEINDIFFEEFK